MPSLPTTGSCCALGPLGIYGTQSTTLARRLLNSSSPQPLPLHVPPPHPPEGLWLSQTELTHHRSHHLTFQTLLSPCGLRERCPPVTRDSSHTSVTATPCPSAVGLCMLPSQNSSTLPHLCGPHLRHIFSCSLSVAF